MKKKANKKTLIIAAVSLLLILSAAGIYIVNGISHKPEVFQRLLTETAQENTDYLFKGSKEFGIPYLSIYKVNDNLQDREGNYLTYNDLYNSSTSYSFYQSKVENMIRDIDEYRISDIDIHEKDPSFANQTTADVTIVFRWYDFDHVTDEFNRYYLNRALPYLTVGTDRTYLFPIIDDLMLSILEKVEDAGMTKEYVVTSKYYLNEGGSNYFTGKGAHWYETEKSDDIIREMILKDLDYLENLVDDPTEEILIERKEIAINMEIAIELYGKEGARKLLEDLGYDGLVEKMVADDTTEDTKDQ